MKDWKSLYRPAPEEQMVELPEKVIRHGRNPENMGKISDANGHSRVEGVCGDTMEMWIKVGPDGTVGEIGFMTDGCISSRACGSVAACIAKGRDIDGIFEISPADVLRELEGALEKHCAILAVSTLHRAVADYMLKTGKQ